MYGYAAGLTASKRWVRELLLVFTLSLLLPFSLPAHSESNDICRQPAAQPMSHGGHPVGQESLFERIEIAGFTDQLEGTAGVALADLNRDGRTDILAVYDTPRKMRMFLNQGCFNFIEHPFEIRDSAFTAEDIGYAANVPNLVDFNGDGFLDIYLTRSRGNPNRPSPSNSLLLTQGAFDVFVDHAGQMGVKNFAAYNRQSSIGDVNGDGYLDIAVGADNIGNTRPGLPLHRLYIYQPAGSGVFEDGHFTDIGGTDLVPGFGGEFTCDADVDRAGPGVTLRDLDNDGDLDLVQSYHADMNGAAWDDPCAVGEYYQGVYVWRNLLKETGDFHFERVTDNGLAEQGRMRYAPDLGYYIPEGHAVGLPYLNTADVDNDGLLDVIAVGPTDVEWHVNSDPIAGRFWRNDGNFLFHDATLTSGFAALNWFYGEWEHFWDIDLPAETEIQLTLCAVSNQYPLCNGLTTQEHQLYGADTVFGDFDNDGWIDMVVADRHELDGAFNALRNVLFLNSANGHFRPIVTEVSGIDANSASMEAADLNDDGLLDLVFAADPKNSYPYNLFPNLPPLPPERFTDKVYWNTGALGGRYNHWLRVHLTGIPDRAAVGARLSVFAKDGHSPHRRLLGVRYLFSNHSYKSSQALEAHFGLGRNDRVEVDVQLANGVEKTFTDVQIDRVLGLDMTGP